MSCFNCLLILEQIHIRRFGEIHYLEKLLDMKLMTEVDYIMSFDVHFNHVTLVPIHMHSESQLFFKLDY